MRTRLWHAAVPALLTLTATPSRAVPILSEDFEGYSLGGLGGQGSWTSGAGIVVFGTALNQRVHVGSTSAAAVATRPLGSVASLAPDETSVLSFQGYGYTYTEVSHNSGVYLGTSSSAAGIGWRSVQAASPLTHQNWLFDASGLTGNSGDMYDPGLALSAVYVSLQVIVDGLNNEAYGRLQELDGPGGSVVGALYESPRFLLTDAQIAELDRLSLVKSFDSTFLTANPRPQTELGAEFDNIRLSDTRPAAAVPDGGSAAWMLGFGAAATLLLRRGGVRV